MSDDRIVFDNVSKFYGEVLGVNHVQLSIAPGITGLVGPNGSGKTTLMNLATGLIQPTAGTVRVLGLATNDPERLFRVVGYASQFDSFPPGVSGRQFITAYLRVHGYTREEAGRRAEAAIARVGLSDASERKVAAYSKGMRQRIRLAQAIAHDPRVLVLDEPLNGLDPMARAEVIQLFQDLAHEGRHVLVSSHILHEVDLISDRVVLINNGYLVAEGEISGVRTEMSEHPVQVFVRCRDPRFLAARLFEQDHTVEVRLHDDLQGLLARTRDPDRFHLLLNRLSVQHPLGIEAVGPADDDVAAVYDYLIGDTGSPS
ncbi:MAG TPA: ABC transporter ATP-binding protein [Thermoanaerobaculia bacterium]|nr:ABC transporter ATP-binding protein [Thermoanaerobaculia bacterium]